MKRGWFGLLAVAALGLALLAGVGSLFGLRVARGDVFPEYSSLRADPLGARALHDAAGLLPGGSAERWLRPLRRLEVNPGDVVIVAGTTRRRPGLLDTDDWRELDRLARSGARVVVAWRAEAAASGDAALGRTVRAEPWADSSTPLIEPEEDEATERNTADQENNRVKKKAETDEALAPPPPQFAREHERRWGFRLMRRELLNRLDEAADAERGEDAPANWPGHLASWRSDLFFLPREGDGWRVLYRRAIEPVMLERTRGAGSVVLLADSFILSNEAVQRERATPVLAALLGAPGRVVFVESHLGVEIETGVAILARRYGLGGAALVAAALAVLWIWRRASPLVPILPDEDEVRLSLAPTAGLEALLRRAVAPNKLFAACLEAWRSGASAGDQRRLADESATAAATTPGGVEPVAAYNAATRALSRKKLS